MSYTVTNRHRRRVEKRRNKFERSSSHLISDDSDAVSQSQTENGSWTSDKVIQELSSFIAEFSYLTNESPEKNTALKQQQDTKKLQKVQVYAANEDPAISPFDNERGNRGVGWRDKPRTVLYPVPDTTQDCDHEECRNRRPPSPNTGEGCGQVQCIHRARSGRRVVRRTSRPRRVSSKRTVVFGHSHSRERSNSREQSCPARTSPVRMQRRSYSNFRASKSRGRRRPRSSSTYAPRGDPMRRRVVSTNRRKSRSPSVRRTPFRYHRPRTREVVCKRSQPKVVYRRIEPCEEPTLVTLFPKTIPRRPRPCSRESEPPPIRRYRSVIRVRRCQSPRPETPPPTAICPQCGITCTTCTTTPVSSEATCSPHAAPCAPCTPCAVTFSPRTNMDNMDRRRYPRTTPCQNCQNCNTTCPPCTITCPPCTITCPPCTTTCQPCTCGQPHGSKSPPFSIKRPVIRDRSPCAPKGCCNKGSGSGGCGCSRANPCHKDDGCSRANPCHKDDGCSRANPCHKDDGCSHANPCHKDDGCSHANPCHNDDGCSHANPCHNDDGCSHANPCHNDDGYQTNTKKYVKSSFSKLCFTKCNGSPGQCMNYFHSILEGQGAFC